MNHGIESLIFKEVVIESEGNLVLEATSLDLPMFQNSRWIFNDDREKYYVFQALSQLECFTQGEFLINQENVLDMSFEEFHKFRMQMGFGFANRGLLQNRTLRENLMLQLDYHELGSESEREKWLDHLMGYFDIRADLGRRPSEVTPFVQKMTLLLRAFIHKPSWVILDAPDMLLKKGDQAGLLQIIQDHREYHGLKHLFFSTADEDLAECLTDISLIFRRHKVEVVEHHSSQRGAA